MKVIVGLGNPGLKYKGTKHNVGFDVVAKIAKEYGIKINQKKYTGLIGTGTVDGAKVMLVLPQTYMNLSGHMVGDLYEDIGEHIADILVICDDVNLKLGRIRMRAKGSSGGHKGLESIIQVLGRDDITRLRVGIATDIHRGDISNYVLTPFKRREAKNAAHALELAKEAVLYWVQHDAQATMHTFNTQKAGAS